MKKYIALLSVALLAGVQTGRADILGLGNISTDASFEVSGQQADNETDGNGGNLDKRGATNTRIRVGLNADIVDGVKGRIEAVRNSNSGGAGVVQYGDGASTVAAEEAAIGFQNAYIDISDFLRTDSFRLGRQYVGRPGDLIMYAGPYNDDALTVMALDALSVTKRWGKLNISAGTGKANENDAVSNTDADDVAALGDVNISWIVVGSDELFAVKVPLELGFYQGTNNAAQPSSDNITLTILDLRAGYAFMDDTVKVGAEYAMNGGQDSNGNAPNGASNYKGTAMLLNASYDNKDYNFGLHLRYADASGDEKGGGNPAAEDKAFHDFRTVGAPVSDYRYGEIMSYDNTAIAAIGGGNFGGGLDTGALGNGINIVNLGGTYLFPVWDNKLTGAADYYVAKVNKVGAGIDDGVGSEIDLSVHYAHSDAISAVVGYATFSPEKGLVNGYAGTANLPTDSVTKLFAKLKVKWGGERAY